jgi:hypothetical protein
MQLIHHQRFYDRHTGKTDHYEIRLRCEDSWEIAKLSEVLPRFKWFDAAPSSLLEIVTAFENQERKP